MERILEPHHIINSVEDADPSSTLEEIRIMKQFLINQVEDVNSSSTLESFLSLHSWIMIPGFLRSWLWNFLYNQTKRATLHGVGISLVFLSSSLQDKTSDKTQFHRSILWNWRQWKKYGNKLNNDRASNLATLNSIPWYVRYPLFMCIAELFLYVRALSPRICPLLWVSTPLAWVGRSKKKSTQTVA